jgi:hypothetical protein
MQQQLSELLRPYANLTQSPYQLAYGCTLILLIVYSSIIPLQYKQFTDSLFGRVLGISIVYAVVHYLGWVYGLLTALAFLLLLHGGIAVSEGFDGGGSVTEKTTTGARWYVEKVLGERPRKIAIQEVHTSAPGDTA